MKKFSFFSIFEHGPDTQDLADVVDAGERRRPGSDCLAARVTPEGRRLESEDLVE